MLLVLEVGYELSSSEDAMLYHLLYMACIKTPPQTTLNPALALVLVPDPAPDFSAPSSAQPHDTLPKLQSTLSVSQSDHLNLFPKPA